jgi:hypothetical protein
MKVAGAANPRLADPSSARALAQLQTMVTDDRVDAEFIAAGTRILTVRARPRLGEQPIGPFVQQHVVRGTLLGLEGKDRTKHARIGEFGTKREISGEIIDDDLARRLRLQLWGDVVEFVGVCRAYRRGDGEWEFRSFRIETFNELDNAPPSKLLAALGTALDAKSGENLTDLYDFRKP